MVAFDQARRPSVARGRSSRLGRMKLRPENCPTAALQSHQSPELVSFDCRHCYFLMVVFGDISIARCHTILGAARTKMQDSATNCARQCELTYPTTGSKMDFDARHLHWNWRQTSSQKNGRFVCTDQKQIPFGLRANQPLKLSCRSTSDNLASNCGIFVRLFGT